MDVQPFSPPEDSPPIAAPAPQHSTSSSEMQSSTETIADLYPALGFVPPSAPPLEDSGIDSWGGKYLIDIYLRR